MQAEARFNAIRGRYLAAVEREHRYRLDVLHAKYRQTRPDRSWLTRGELDKLERLRAAQDREGEKMFELLGRISPRYWDSGAPYAWVMESLSFADAITTGPLSTVPPAAYGSSTRDMERFAAPLALAA